MFSNDKTEIEQILDKGESPVFARQIGGITWIRVSGPKPLIKPHIHLEFFEYWVGEDYPTMPASVDPDYPMHMRPKLREVLDAARSRAKL